MRDVTDKKGNILIPDGADLDDVVDDNKDSEYYDIIGDIQYKLKSNECGYYMEEVNNTANNNRLNDDLFACYNEFKKRNKLKGDKNNSFPRMRRFCTLIDRRKYVTKTKKMKCDSSNEDDEECECHETQDRNCDGMKKDDMFFWIPPKNCDKLPDDKNGYVSEVYFENLNKCIIPRIGYIDSIKDGNDNNDHFNIEDSVGIHTSTKCRLLRSTLTNSCTNDGILTFNFHVQSIDEIRCYLWFKGSCIRFFPEDIINILPLIFDLKYQKNQQFATHQKIKDLVKQIQFTDKYFDEWYKGITNKKT